MATRPKKKGNEKSKERLTTDETDITYECTGNIFTDFVELCKRSEISFPPPIVAQERLGQPSVALDHKQPKNKLSGKISQIEVESCTSDKTIKTYKLVENSEFNSPKITVVQDLLEKPDVSECMIKDWNIVPYIEVLAKCWAALDKLNTLKLWNVSITTESSIQLLKCVNKMKNLRTLCLEGNSENLLTYHLFINDEAVVKFLSFRFNKLTDNNAIMIGKSLQKVKYCDLVSLNISNNNISDEGAIHLANALKQNRSLLSLDLSQNNIGDPGAASLSEALSKYELKHSEIVQRRKQKVIDKLERESSDCTAFETVSLKTPEKTVKSTSKSHKKKKEDEFKPGKLSKKESEKHSKRELRPTSKSREKLSKERSLAESSVVADIKDTLNEKTNVNDGRVFVSGNNTILNMNLAYNKITENGLNNLLKAVLFCCYGKNFEEKYVLGDGLLSLTLENNLFDNNHQDMEKIKNLLQIKNPFNQQTSECLSSGSTHSKK